MMLEGAGFEMVDLGTDVEPQALSTPSASTSRISSMSALLTTTLVQMRSTVEALEESGMRDSVKVIVGGASVTSAFSDEIGANAYAPDAASAVDVARGSAGTT
jgi:5-methyltetrahydrofolate--homocysteine methyltransferase